MGRRTNEKCWACSLLTSEEARKLHDAEMGGDGCWREETCRSRRSYYRKGRSRLAQRKTAIEAITVPIPKSPMWCCTPMWTNPATRMMRLLFMPCVPSYGWEKNQWR